MLTPVLIVVAAFAASAVGSPYVAFWERISHRGTSEDAAYTVQVLKGSGFAGPGALISEQYVVCAAHILGNDDGASSLSVKAGTNISFPFNPWGQTVAVANAFVHPDAGVAVLKLAEPITIKSAEKIPVIKSSLTPLPGSLAVVSGWSGAWPWLSVEEQWLVLPEYCQASGALCLTGDFKEGAVLNVKGNLVGLATARSQGPVKDLVSYVNLAEDSVQKFIAAATANGSAPVDPTTTPAPAPTTKPTEAPTTTSRPQPSGKTCQFHVNGGLPKNEPILLYEDTLAFREPDSSGLVSLQDGKILRLVCSGDDNAFLIDKTKQLLTAQCDDGDFVVDGKPVSLSDLACKSTAHSSTRRAGTCGDQGQFTRVLIGFEVERGFVPQIENCFDSENLDAVYSRANMTPAVAAHETGVKRPSFAPDDFYGSYNPNSLFNRNSQQTAVGKLLGDAGLGKKYIKSGSSNYFLARGHLSAKGDYIQGAQQRATFHYINTAPQWQTFNGDNWEKLESSVRDYVISSGRSVQVITGTWSVATLPNKEGVETELYLEADAKKMRVPKYYWKVVYDPATREAAAFVGMNNPYYEAQNGDVICEDVCGRYTWLTWAPKDQQAGIGFCCDVNQLRKVITTIPKDLDVIGLL